MRIKMGSPKLERAKAWLNGELLENSEVDIQRKLRLIEEASLKFDLSPIDGEYLHAHLKVNKMSQEEISKKMEALRTEISALETQIFEKKKEFSKLMAICKHPNEHTVEDSKNKKE